MYILSWAYFSEAQTCYANISLVQKKFTVEHDYKTYVKYIIRIIISLQWSALYIHYPCYPTSQPLFCIISSYSIHAQYIQQ